MTEQDKPKITLSFTENRKRVSLKQFKKLSKFYLVVVFVIGVSEAILDLTGKITFGFLEGSVDFFALTVSFIALLFFTVPIMRTQSRMRRIMAILRVASYLLSIQIVALLIFYFAFPRLGSVTYFEAFIVSEIAYQVALAFITGGYKFNRKFLSIQIGNGIRIRNGTDGYVESIERSDFMTQELRNTIEDKISGKISEEKFLEAISGFEPYEREMIISMTSGIETRLRKKYRW